VIARLLALALLLAQLGAEVHACSHLVTDQPGVPGPGLSCGTCLSFAPLLSAVGAPQLVLLVHRREIECVVAENAIPVPYQAPPLAFRSRAPPLALL